jgi:hypothetical protein
MSKFSSIALGHCSGSIGNVTTNRLKGQQIAKAKIISTTNVNSVGQVTSRSKMKNIVMAWQFLAPFLINAKGLRKKTESVYNAFVRGFKTGISDIVADSRSAAAALLDSVSGLEGNFIKVVGTSGSLSAAVFNLNTGGLQYVEGVKLAVIGWDASTGLNAIYFVPLTESEWSAGITSPINIEGGDTDRAAYVYTPDGKKCSNLFFA